MSSRLSSISEVNASEIPTNPEDMFLDVDLEQLYGICHQIYGTNSLETD